MTIQQWLFSFKGRIGRRDFWIWIGPLVCRDAGAIFAGGEKTCLISKRRHFAWCACCGRPPPSWSNVCMTGGRFRRVGVADDSGVDAAGRKLGDAAGDVAVGSSGDLFRR
ncbi:membrane protein [Salmonella enterica subsp. enterica]|uniref:Membrane protein n=1 Tax=Salmonella enterica I TaxID=59201 RepID=A0A447TQN6_SALET|nr:membrane protein [Salmonella enterica subsp. enterica]